MQNNNIKAVSYYCDMLFSFFTLHVSGIFLAGKLNKLLYTYESLSNYMKWKRNDQTVKLLVRPDKHEMPTQKEMDKFGVVDWVFVMRPKTTFEQMHIITLSMRT